MIVPRVCGKAELWLNSDNVDEILAQTGLAKSSLWVVLSVGLLVSEGS